MTQRHLDSRRAEYYDRPRTELLPYIPITCRKILDCGCGYGMLGTALKARAPCRVIGVERDPLAAAGARKHLDAVFEQDVEQPIDERDFDCIIYADVLEHLVDPWRLVRNHVSLLVPGGQVLMSIPNVRHFSVAYMLYAKGRWRYTESGIMDRTHLRFFTLKDIKDMVREAGLQLDTVTSNCDAWSWKTFLVRMSIGWLIPDTLVVQWIVRSHRPVEESAGSNG